MKSSLKSIRSGLLLPAPTGRERPVADAQPGPEFDDKRDNESLRSVSEGHTIIPDH